MARILVVDDSRLARAALRRNLEQAGHQVTEAADAEAALLLLKDGGFDLISSDVLMPGLDGRAFLNALTGQPGSPPVLVVTADVQLSTREEFLRRGAAAVVNKPFAPDVLLAAVDAALGERQRSEPRLSDEQKADLADVVNIAVGHAAAALNDLTGLSVELKVPEVDVVTVPALARTFSQLVEETLSSVQMGFRGGLDGCAFLVFPPSSAAKLASLVAAIANLLDLRLRYSLPVYSEGRMMDLLAAQHTGSIPVILVARARFEIRESQIDGSLLLLFEMTSFESLLRALTRRGGGR
jgi:CheY-like chemotaxis protein